MVLDGLLDLYGFKYDSGTTYGLSLYLCSYKLVGSTTVGAVLEFMYPVPGHPPMRPEPGFVDFVSFLSPCSSFHLNFRPPDANLGIAGSAERTVLQG